MKSLMIPQVYNYIFVSFADEIQFKCTSNRRSDHFNQKRRNIILEEQTKMGKCMEITVALMAFLAISIFFGIFLFLFIMFVTLGKLKIISQTSKYPLLGTFK